MRVHNGPFPTRARPLMRAKVFSMLRPFEIFPRADGFVGVADIAWPRDPVSLQDFDGARAQRKHFLAAPRPAVMSHLEAPVSLMKMTV